MRFNNDDYLKAFPREERAAATEKTVVKDEPGDVFDNEDEKTPAGDPETEDLEASGGEEGGDE